MDNRLRIVFKSVPGEERSLNTEWLAKLRAELPPIFDRVPDQELYDCYARYSEEFHCAGWLSHNKESLEQGFLKQVELLDENGQVVS